MDRGAQVDQEDLDAPLGRSSKTLRSDTPAAGLGLEKSRVISNSGWNVEVSGVELTLDVVSNSPGDGGVVHGLVDPAEVGLRAFRAAM